MYGILNIGYKRAIDGTLFSLGKIVEDERGDDQRFDEG